MLIVIDVCSYVFPLFFSDSPTPASRAAWWMSENQHCRKMRRRRMLISKCKWGTEKTSLSAWTKFILFFSCLFQAGIQGPAVDLRWDAKGGGGQAKRRSISTICWSGHTGQKVSNPRGGLQHYSRWFGATGTTSCNSWWGGPGTRKATCSSWWEGPGTRRATGTSSWWGGPGARRAIGTTTTSSSSCPRRCGRSCWEEGRPS